MKTFAKMIVAKAPTAVYAFHRKLSYLPLIGSGFTVLLFLAVIVLCQHVPIPDAPHEVNGGNFMHAIGHLRWVLLLLCVMTFPAWLILTLFSALPRNRYYFNWRSTTAYVLGAGLYCLLFYHSYHNGQWNKAQSHYDSTGHYDGTIDWFFE